MRRIYLFILFGIVSYYSAHANLKDVRDGNLDIRVFSGYIDSLAILAGDVYSCTSDSILVDFFNKDILCIDCKAVEIVTTGEIPLSSLCSNIYCNSDGSVSIGGTSSASGYKLSINGKAIAVSIKISPSSVWPDYVFHKSYQLRSLPELKKYISQNGHLPDVPSAEDVAEKGIDAGEMSTLLLRKTEELTLYLIQLDERLRKLENEID